MAAWRASACKNAADVSPNDDAVLERFREYRHSGDRAARNQLVEDHRWIALRCARRFEGRGEPLDDLIQVAQLGVLKAVERFDPEHGAAFPSFAMPTVMELHVSLGRAVERLNHALGRQPTVEELAEELRVTPDDILEALDAGAAYRTAPLTRPEDDSDREPGVLGAEDGELAQVDSRMAVRRLLDTLPPRERTLVYLRFFGSLTQQEIAERLGMSQVHVSRLLRQCMNQLQSSFEEDPVGDNGV